MTEPPQQAQALPELTPHRRWTPQAIGTQPLTALPGQKRAGLLRRFSDGRLDSKICPKSKNVNILYF